MIIKDYLDGEIADLKLVLADRLPYGIYLRLKKARDDKRDMLLATDKDLVTERFNLTLKKDTLPKRLANIATMTSFLEMCVNNLENICIKL